MLSSRSSEIIKIKWHKTKGKSSKYRQLNDFCTTFKKNILAEVATISRGVFEFRRF